jgi:hypothetical protein
MRSSSGYIFGIGLGLVLLSVLNHFVFRAYLLPNFTKILFGIGVLAIIGAVALFAMGSGTARSGKSS